MQLAITAGWSWLARGGHGQPACRSDSASKGTPHGSGLSPRLVEGGTPPDGGRQSSGRDRSRESASSNRSNRTALSRSDSALCMYIGAYSSAVATTNPEPLPGAVITPGDRRHGVYGASCAFRARERLHDPFHENDISDRG
jgi:hypothetical protein